MIIQGDVGTVEVGGSTDFVQWKPLDVVKGLVSKDDIVDVAYEALIAT